MIPDERKLVAKFRNQPFVLLGINSDESRSALRKIIKEHRITWPNIYDGPPSRGKDTGGIAQNWNVQSWPTIYLIDDQGVIRRRNPSEKHLKKTIAELLKQATEKKRKSPTVSKRE